MLFENEAKMQEWLCDNLEGNEEGLIELITNDHYLENYVPGTKEEEKFYQSLSRCRKALNLLVKISADENVSLDTPDILRPDLLLYSIESQGVVIVELKNLAGTTREAGTELGAYSCEVRTYLPHLSEDDLFHVIISPTWPTLIRHYISHEILWNQKNILCLQPVKVGDSIQLEILQIDEFLSIDIGLTLSGQHLAGYQMCMYDDELLQAEERAPNNKHKRLENHHQQMKTALQIIASEGQRQRSHGFAFLWKDHHPLSMAPFNISVFHIDPFKATERFVRDNHSGVVLNNFQSKLLDTMKYYDPTGHGDSLNNIRLAGTKFLDSFCSCSPEGFHTWDVYKPMMLERAQLMSFQCWGVFEEVRNVLLTEAYESGNLSLARDDSNLGLDVISTLIDDSYICANLYE